MAVCYAACGRCSNDNGGYSIYWTCDRRLSEEETPAAITNGTRRRLLFGAPYSRFPGGAERHVELASANQIHIADFDGDGRKDLFVHAPAPSAGSCAMRCHEQGRFGYDSFELRHANVAADNEAEPTYCYCGPHYDLMVGPPPPPSPPKPPPSPSAPPRIPPIPSPDVPPPSPPAPLIRAVGLCTLHAGYDLPPASPRPDEAEDLDENLDPGQIEQFVNVLLAYEAGVRNHDMSNADKHKDTRALVQSYDRFLSLVQTLRQQALSARWDAGVRRAIDASWGYHEVTSTVKAAANVMAVDEQVKTLRNGPTVACMLCNQNCDAGSMRFFNLFGQRPPYEECERAGPLGAFSADAWIKANLSDLHAMWERLETAYECDDMKDEINTMSRAPAYAELPAEALGTVAVGAD